jgi:hypothetical protein
MWAPPRRATVSGVRAGATWGWEVRSVAQRADQAFGFEPVQLKQHTIESLRWARNKHPKQR